MRMETKGCPEAPAMLFFPGMLCTAKSVWTFAQHMQTEGYYLLPTLSGHYADSPDYLSKEAEAEAILQWLEEHGITRLKLLQGTSMGAEVALEFYRQAQGRIQIDHCLFDGGPFFHFPWLFRRMMEGKFRQMAKLMQYDSAEEALAALRKIPVIRQIIGNDGEKYLPMLRTMLLEKHTISPATLHHVTETCYRYDLPAFGEADQRRMLFLYSDDEPAYKAKKRLLQAYPHAVYRDVQGLGHCGWQTSDPETYAAMVDAYIRG